MLSSDQKGSIAETAVIHEAVKLGIGVLKPVNDGLRYDLVLDIDERLVRVQVKWASRKADVIDVRCYSSRRSAAGFVRRPYTLREIDAVVAYCPELGRCYFLPLDDFGERTEIRLRLAKARNNQEAGVNRAEDYEFAARLGEPGAVAQLGERVAGSHEVRGSIPLGSTALSD
jgi:hypothetical protein